MTVQVYVPGQPRGKGRPRFARVGGGVRTYTDAKTASYEAVLRLAGAQAMQGMAPLEGALRVSVNAWMRVPASWSKRKQADALAFRLWPTAKPDADNLVKTLDALNGIVWRDDAQIVEMTVRKVYAGTPALVINVESLV